ncbi:MAG TPA: hypothetical protein DEG17_20285 [Cyanobacteria bacterium UBA11149]|nr:hypothetical protein [Cyanobacteria bacterium UBA11367]HBE56539.1 hypothetical protein [Cyanobacteria bacterium UBA11366]HBK62367.1 hypothetical protein [Cyanobacteria bacterium UBA11166]HBR75672.1 hypothetical protein [Cyanobacteria bacterium UBA11159]HBS68602.1 hypothetical protein [Cyanobacteria bacterium UBA11153]HBW91135.1 hypothetical protein [Cyanobacteria bacterium UBA11149]HCA97995.1 hypothetical protein [Cyanobacteria bacterium UBA9226]
MKSLIRWTVTLGLTGTTILSSLLTGTLQALALTQAQIIEKLQTVPVFAIADAQGSLVTVSVPTQDNKTVSVAGFFISQQAAQSFINQRLKRDNPQLGNTAQVAVLSIADVYKLQQENKNKPNPVDFVFVPEDDEVKTAVDLLRQKGENVQQFDQVPLFYASAGQDSGYLTTELSGQQVIPFFFDKNQLQGLVDRYKQQQPNQSSTVQINVVTLEGLIETWESKDDPALGKIVLWPTPESIEILQKISSSSQQSGGNNR